MTEITAYNQTIALRVEELREQEKYCTINVSNCSIPNIFVIETWENCEQYLEIYKDNKFFGSTCGRFPIYTLTTEEAVEEVLHNIAKAC